MSAIHGLSTFRYSATQTYGATSARLDVVATHSAAAFVNPYSAGDSYVGPSSASLAVCIALSDVGPQRSSPAAAPAGGKRRKRKKGNFLKKAKRQMKRASRQLKSNFKGLVRFAKDALPVVLTGGIGMYAARQAGLLPGATPPR
jgi:NaMN:DMB phosphoribosyltransferase